jgi:hypothetical protein
MPPLASLTTLMEIYPRAHEIPFWKVTRFACH